MSEFADELRAEIAQLEQDLSTNPQFLMLEKLRGWLAKYEAEAASKPKKRGGNRMAWTPERRAAQSKLMAQRRRGEDKARSIAEPVAPASASPAPPWAALIGDQAPALHQTPRDAIAITATGGESLENKPRVGPPTPRPDSTKVKVEVKAAKPAVPPIKDRDRDAISAYLKHRGATKVPSAHARGSVEEKLSPLG